MYAEYQMNLPISVRAVHTPDAFCTARAPTVAHEASGVASQSAGSNKVSVATAQPRVPMLSLSLSPALSRHAADRYASVTSAPILARS